MRSRRLANQSAALAFCSSDGNVPAGASLADAQKAGVVLAWGNFITILLNFIILAFVIFWMVKAFNRVKTNLDAAPAATPEDVLLLREIRDSLKK